MIHQFLYAVPADVSAKNKCELFLQKIPGFNPLVLTDVNGKTCRGSIALPLCRGFCKTSESGSYIFPHRVQNSSACTLIPTGVREIALTDCDEGADDLIRTVKVPSGEKCGCKRFPLD